MESGIDYGNKKNEDLAKHLGDSLIKDGFDKIVFKNRVIYIKEDLGENLNDLIKNKSLSKTEIKSIIEQLINKMILGVNGRGDIKINNIVFDAETGIVNFIDDKELLFIFTTIDQYNKGIYVKKLVINSNIIRKQNEGLFFFNNNSWVQLKNTKITDESYGLTTIETQDDLFFSEEEEDDIINQQILCLTYVFFQLLNNLNYNESINIVSQIHYVNERRDRINIPWPIDDSLMFRPRPPARPVV